MEFKKIGEINEYKSKSVNPAKNPDMWYELYSIPSYEYKFPEIVQGKDIASSKQIVEKGDILISKINPRINRVWIVSNHSNYIKIASSEWIVVRTKKISNKYLSYYFKSDKFKNLLTSQVTGIGGSLTRAQPKNVKNYEVPLLSLDQQNKVVELLDQVINVIEKRTSQIAALDQLTQSVFLEMFGDIRTNTKKFFKTKLKEVISEISTGKSLAGNEISRYKVLKTSSVSFKFFKPNEVKNLPLNYVPPSNHLVKKGDILVSRMNTSELVGAAGYVFEEIENVALPDRIWKLHYNEKVNPIFLWYYINQPSFRTKVSDIATGTSGSMKNIAQKKYLNIDIILPPIEVQNKFGDLLIEFEFMKKQLNNSLIEIEKTYNAITQRAFKGELFTNDKVLNA
jgi:type I restriction enzyme, S subunit